MLADQKLFKVSAALFIIPSSSILITGVDSSTASFLIFLDMRKVDDKFTSTPLF